MLQSEARCFCWTSLAKNTRSQAFCAESGARRLVTSITRLRRRSEAVRFPTLSGLGYVPQELISLRSWCITAPCPLSSAAHQPQTMTCLVTDHLQAGP